jgi:hypothetical protein
MDPDALREQLRQLHQELGVASRLDPRSTQLLGEIMVDIKRLLEQSAAAEESPSPPGRQRMTAPPRSLPDRLEQIAVQFEVDHPTLAASSRRLVDMLAKAGL